MKRFLVVEDDPAIGRLLTLLLQHDGHRAVSVTCAAEALDHLRGSDVDVVLSELRIGPSMDGLQLSERVRREWPGVKFVLCTCSICREAAVAQDQGGDMFLTKPYRLADLRQIVAAMSPTVCPLPWESVSEGGRTATDDTSNRVARAGRARARAVRRDVSPDGADPTL